MRRRPFLALVLAALCHPVAAMTWEDYSRRRAETEVRFYVAGVGAGFFYTNIYLNEVGRAKLYCQPKSVDIPGAAYGAILDEHGARLGEKATGVSVEILLLAALSKIYPCR